MHLVLVDYRYLKMRNRKLKNILKAMMPFLCVKNQE